jgi:hypothetical protein
MKPEMTEAGNVVFHHCMTSGEVEGSLFPDTIPENTSSTHAKSLSLPCKKLTYDHRY